MKVRQLRVISPAAQLHQLQPRCLERWVVERLPARIEQQRRQGTRPICRPHAEQDKEEMGIGRNAVLKLYIRRSCDELIHSYA